MTLKDKKSLILYNSVGFFIPHFKKNGALVSSVFRKSSFVSKVVRMVFRKLSLHQDYWYNDWKADLNSIDTVIVFAPAQLDVFRYIKKTNNDIRIIYWYWNPVFRVGTPNKNVLSFVEAWSFDTDDCQQYQMKFNTTFYFNSILLNNTQKKYDVIFIGIDKGRRAYLENLENKLNTIGINTYFHIVPNKDGKTKTQIKPIPYEEYLILLSESKAIADIKPIQQSGLTLRVMESIFFRKKLITNDLSIAAMDFYNTDNIFIIGKDDDNFLKEFIDTPYCPVDDSIIKNYDFMNWIERFEL